MALGDGGNEIGGGVGFSLIRLTHISPYYGGCVEDSVGLVVATLLIAWHRMCIVSLLFLTNDGAV